MEAPMRFLKRDPGKAADGPTDPGGGEPGRLSAGGRVRRWVVGKPRIAADVAAITHEEDTSVNVWGVVGRLLLLLAGFTVAVGAATWFALSFTVMPSVQAGDSVWMVKRGGWDSGYAPPGSQVLVMEGEVDRGLLSRATLPFMPPGANMVGTVFATPTDTVQVGPAGTVVVSGSDSGLPPPAAGLPPPGSAYLVTCIEGGCVPGETVAVPPTKVLGDTVTETPIPSFGAGGNVG